MTAHLLHGPLVSNVSHQYQTGSVHSQGYSQAGTQGGGGANDLQQQGMAGVDW